VVRVKPILSGIPVVPGVGAMTTIVRLVVPTAACVLLVTTAVGCSTGVGQTLGLSGPQHRLIPDAKAFRESAGIPELPRELNKSLHPTFVVEPGDVLLVQPVEFDAPVRLTGDQPVLPDGTIDLGKYGRPVVAGKTVPVIETEVQQLITKQEKEPVPVTVRLISRASKVFYVLGEVNAPGAFPLSGRETVLDAIMVAGGLTRRASEKNIILSRPTPPDGCRVVLPVCYPQVVQLGDSASNYQVMAGDRIYVPSKTMLEDLFPNHSNKKKAGCDPCDKPQFPCNTGGCVGTPASTIAAPALPAPVVVLPK
jgi:protein involved in polysaccharide export with SLBB domain